MSKVEYALKIMKEKGFKNTPKRQAMLEVIEQSKRFVSAREVQEVLKEKYAGLSYDTVYRNLYTFVEQGILEMSERSGEKVFLMHCAKQQHHHHFICDQCQAITEIALCPMDYFTQQLPGYQILGHRFELTGLCAKCAGQIVTPQNQVSHASCGCGHH